MGLCQPEIENLDLTLGRDDDVGGLQIPVNDAVLVCSFQRLGDLAGDLQGFIDLDAARSGEPVSKRLPLNQLHRDEAHATGLL